ncbi:alanine racemase [Legionella norrlandica]|uniref:Alanine racemase n=1 Tax=Legionella norrlandica TaxID=1498499 RepID=A0A0A2SVA9_9GAMM|nr:alanine racemase [Legionella norrlandica]KGP63671.1 alanine racemase [Legionella norrlandica]
MSRPTRLVIEPSALVHNLSQIRHLAPGKKIIAMVKANAYGCGVREVAPVLDGRVDAFGVACLEEALAIRALGVETPCILFQGVFSSDELSVATKNKFACVLHHSQQVQWLINTPLSTPLKVWVKINTGMHRLGFKAHELQNILEALQACPWVDKNIGLMTHLACADEPHRPENQKQISLFQEISIPGFSERSIANSAAIISFPDSHADVVRPGIMLYGVSPFANQTAWDLGLIPVMRFISAISAIHDNPSFAQVGYGGTWKSDKASRIGIVAAGYGDGYPRHISENTPVWVRGREVFIVGRISMDMLAIDLTNHPDIEVGDVVELWGAHILVERVAKSAGTIGYELLCQISERVRHS